MNDTANLRPATATETYEYLNGYRAIEGAVETEHGVMVPADRNVVIYETRFLEDDVHDGDFPRDDVTVTVYDCDDVDDAVRYIEQSGCTFGATGTDWAADPDGSRIVNYGTGERVETTAHLYGWEDDDVVTIIERVG